MFQRAVPRCARKSYCLGVIEGHIVNVSLFISVAVASFVAVGMSLWGLRHAP